MMQPRRTETHCQNRECEKLFFLAPWQLKRGSRFCSRACADIGNKVGVRFCFVCGKNETLLREGKYPSWFNPFNILTMTIYFCRKCRNKFLYQYRRRITHAPTRVDISGTKNPFYGKRHCPETKKRIGESSIGRNVGRKAPLEEIVKIKQARAKQILPIKNTSIEQTIQRELKERKVEFEPHRRFWIGYFSHAVDIFINPNIVIECDGEHWHTRLIPNNNKNCRVSPLYRDYLIDAELERRGMRVIRLSYDSIRNHLPWCMQLISKALTHPHGADIDVQNEQMTRDEQSKSEILDL